MLALFIKMLLKPIFSLSMSYIVGSPDSYRDVLSLYTIVQCLVHSDGALLIREDNFIAINLFLNAFILRILKAILCPSYFKLLSKMLWSAPLYGPLCLWGNWKKKKLLCLELLPIGVIYLYIFVLCLHLACLKMFYSLIFNNLHVFLEVLSFCLW